MNYIVISNKERGFARRASMRHELSHIVLLHYADLVFLLLCTIVNPICWFVMKEIKVVHEYEADDEVINHYRIQSRDYQRLLIMRTVGAEAYALACSFNLNIKKRIMMMKKKQSTWWRILWIAVTIPLVGIALTAFSKPKEALKEVVDSSASVIYNLPSTIYDSEAAEAEVIEPQGPTPVEEAEPAEVEDDVKPGDMITGCVTDEKNMPLMMVNILEKDEYGRIVAHTVSDLNGDFAFKLVNPQHKLSVSCPGFATQTLDIKDKEVNVVLKHNARLIGATATDRIDSIEANDSHFKDEDLPQDGTFHVVEQLASFPGGQEKLSLYLVGNMRYPAIAEENRVEVPFLQLRHVPFGRHVRLARHPREHHGEERLSIDLNDALEAVRAGMRQRGRVFAEMRLGLAVRRLDGDAVEAVRQIAYLELRLAAGRQIRRGDGFSVLVRHDERRRLPGVRRAHSHNVLSGDVEVSLRGDRHALGLGYGGLFRLRPGDGLGRSA